MSLIQNVIVTKITLLIMIIMLVSCASTPKIQSFEPHYIATKQVNPNLKEATNTWNKLQPLSSTKLRELQKNTTNTNEKAWAELALISKQFSHNQLQLVNALLNWREHYPSHIGNALLPSSDSLATLTQKNRPQQIAVLLPQTGSYASSAQLIKAGLLKAYYSNRDIATKPIIKFYNTEQGSIDNIYRRAVQEGADFVIGPLLKDHVQQLSNLSITTPTLTLNYGNNTQPQSNQLYQYGLLPEDEARQMAIKARQNYSRALVIAPQTAWGERLASAFVKEWQEQGGTIQDSWYYPSKADFNAGIANILKIDTNLDKKLMKAHSTKQILASQRRQDIDVIALFSSAQEAHVIVPLLRYYYAGDIPVYATAAVTQKINMISRHDLRGVIVCNLPSNRQQSTKNRLFSMGEDAFLLSQALPRMTQLPHFPIYGTTGALVLKQQQIHRRLPCEPING